MIDDDGEFVIIFALCTPFFFFFLSLFTCDWAESIPRRRCCNYFFEINLQSITISLCSIFTSLSTVHHAFFSMDDDDVPADHPPVGTYNRVWWWTPPWLGTGWRDLIKKNIVIIFPPKYREKKLKQRRKNLFDGSKRLHPSHLHLISPVSWFRPFFIDFLSRVSTVSAFTPYI